MRRILQFPRAARGARARSYERRRKAWSGNSHTYKRRGIAAAIAVSAIALAALLPGRAMAQEATTGTIEGQVADDRQGRFLAPFLTPGRHSVRVELQGFRTVTVEDVDVALGQRVNMSSVTLRVSGLEETVQVVATEPAVDLTSSSTGASLESEFLARLPTQRHVSDVLQLAPGVADSGGAGEANPSISGASDLENQYVIDRVMTSESQRTAGILLIVMPTVMYGGGALLGMIVGDPEYMGNPLRQNLWRAGHAHAGVLLILSLVALRYLDEANLAKWMKSVVRNVIPMAAILMPQGSSCRW
jgi:hypothetical protein